MAVVYGRHIIADPKICHGQFTFRGTRILVNDVLDQIASGMAWESVAASWGGKISKEAIAEAVRLAQEALSKHGGDLAVQQTVR